VGPENQGQTAQLPVLHDNYETWQRKRERERDTRHTVTAQLRNVTERDQTHSYCTTTKCGRERPDTQLLHNYEM